ncbi:hypothetical protein M3J09_010348 [Ascochyta lentis]
MPPSAPGARPRGRNHKKEERPTAEQFQEAAARADLLNARAESESESFLSFKSKDMPVSSTRLSTRDNNPRTPNISTALRTPTKRYRPIIEDSEDDEHARHSSSSGATYNTNVNKCGLTTNKTTLSAATTHEEQAQPQTHTLTPLVLEQTRALRPDGHSSYSTSSSRRQSGCQLQTATQSRQAPNLIKGQLLHSKNP